MNKVQFETPITFISNLYLKFFIMIFKPKQISSERFITPLPPLEFLEEGIKKYKKKPMLVDLIQSFKKSLKNKDDYTTDLLKNISTNDLKIFQKNSIFTLRKDLFDSNYNICIRTLENIHDFIKSTPIDEFILPVIDYTTKFLNHLETEILKNYKDFVIKSMITMEILHLENNPIEMDRDFLSRLLYSKYKSTLIIDLFIAENLKTKLSRFFLFTSITIFLYFNQKRYTFNNRCYFSRKKENLKIKVGNNTEAIPCSALLAATGLFQFKNPGKKYYFEDSLSVGNRLNVENTRESKIFDFNEIPDVERSAVCLPIFLDNLADIQSETSSEYFIDSEEESEYKSISFNNNEERDIDPNRKRLIVGLDDLDDYEVLEETTSQNRLQLSENCKLFINIANESYVITPPTSKRGQLPIKRNYDVVEKDTIVGLDNLVPRGILLLI